MLYNHTRVKKKWPVRTERESSVNIPSVFGWTRTPHTLRFDCFSSSTSDKSGNATTPRYRGALGNQQDAASCERLGKGDLYGLVSDGKVASGLDEPRTPAHFCRGVSVLDTYDPRHAIHTAIEVALRSQEILGHTLAAVHLDSGDIAGDSIYIREQLNNAGLHGVRILASGDLDEWKITELLEAGAQIDSFGVGTALGSGAGSVERAIAGGALGAVYKEVWYVDETGTEHPKVKIAGPKTTWSGKKEIYRHPQWEEDIIQLAHEPRPENYQRLFRPVVRNGEMIPGSLPPLSEIRELAQQNIAMLPAQYRELSVEQPYPVHFSDGLQALRKQAAQLIGSNSSTIGA